MLSDDARDDATDDAAAGLEAQLFAHHFAGLALGAAADVGLRRRPVDGARSAVEQLGYDEGKERCGEGRDDGGDDQRYEAEPEDEFLAEPIRESATYQPQEDHDGGGRGYDDPLVREAEAEGDGVQRKEHG